MDKLDYDLLEALIAHEPEYSWEDQATAPVPPVALPPSFMKDHYENKNALADLQSSFALNRRDSEGGGSGTRQGKKTIARANPKHSTANNWTSNVFPFNYTLPLPPSLLTPLLVLKANDPLPRSSVVTSPYLRIPPFTYCARTSANWRMSNVASLRSRCHLDHLPYFGEHDYENENEFRDKVTDSGVKMAFHIPNEDEKDEPEPPPSNSICGICLVVGCIMHHKAEAVALPQTGPEESGPSKSLLLPAQAVQSSSLGPAQASRMIRRKSRSSQICGSECFLALKAKAVDEADIEHEPLASWSKQERDRFEEVLEALRNVITGDAREKQLTSCLVSMYMMTRNCIDVEFALREKSKDYDDLEFMGESVPMETDEQVVKKRKMQHEKQRQGEVGSKHKNKKPDVTEFSEEEIKLKAPRTVLPWTPCWHPGKPCTSYTGAEEVRAGDFCACRRNGTFCESGCGCPVDCPERFPGCTCADDNVNGACKQPIEDGKGKAISGCPCAIHFRECHPELCAGHDGNMRKCKFMTMQDDRAIRTFIGNSDLEGYGLFVGEDTGAQSRVFIGEYRGEVINENEAQERSLLYQTRQRSYLFDLTKLSVVDGMRLGNKTRYINTARTRGKNNCRGDTIQINGEARLLVHANKEGKQKLQKNDELLLDYGDNYELFADPE